MRNLGSELRLALRSLAKSPGFTSVAILTLALGVGGNAVIFSLVDGVLLRGVPFPKADRLVVVESTTANHSPADFLDFQAENRSFEGLAGYAIMRRNLSGRGEPERIRIASGSPELFEVLQPTVALGRVWTAADAEDERLVVLSHGYWQRRFGGDPAALGQVLVLDDEPARVIGVLDPGQAFPESAELFQLGRQGLPEPPFDLGENLRGVRGLHYFRVLGRLAPGVSLETADQEMAALAVALEEAYPDANEGRTLTIRTLQESRFGDLRVPLLVLQGAVVLVLLVAGANVANLLLVRANRRRSEAALRRALGASRFQLFRQGFVEAQMLALAGGLAGLMLAFWGLDLVLALVPADLPGVERVSLSSRVIVSVFALVWLVGSAFSLLPFFGGVSPGESFSRGGRATESRRSQRLRRGLVVAEIACALALVLGAGLLIRSLERLQAVDPGFRTEGVLTASLALPQVRYPGEQEPLKFFEPLLERLGSLPGVESAAGVTMLPLGGSSMGFGFRPEDGAFAPGTRMPAAVYQAVTQDYFRVLGIPLIEGRTFNSRDGAGAPSVVVVNRTLAERFFPGRSARGRRLTFDDESTDEAEWSTIVGVVGDVRHRTLDKTPGPQIYGAFRQDTWTFFSLVLRTSHSAEELAPVLRRTVAELDPVQPISAVRELDEVVSASAADPRFRTLILGLFAGLALVLAAVGIFGVVAYSVSQRTRELGIRQVVGVEPGDVLRLIVAEGARLVVAGVALGAAAGLALAHLFRQLLFGIAPSDPLTFVAVPALLAAVTLGASYLAARRAMAVPPTVALRQD